MCCVTAELQSKYFIKSVVYDAPDTASSSPDIIWNVKSGFTTIYCWPDKNSINSTQVWWWTPGATDCMIALLSFVKN